jgi:hypothetical protein
MCVSTNTLFFWDEILQPWRIHYQFATQKDVRLLSDGIHIVLKLLVSVSRPCPNYRIHTNTTETTTVSWLWDWQTIVQYLARIKTLSTAARELVLESMVALLIGK